MADYDGSRYYAIHEEAVGSNKVLDTWASNSLRSNEYWLNENEPGCSKHYLSGGIALDRADDRPITSFVWSDFEYIPFRLDPGLIAVEVGLHYRIATSVEDNLASTDLDFRIGLRNIRTFSTVLEHQGALDYQHGTYRLDLPSRQEESSLTFLTLGVRGRVTPVEEGDTFFARYPGSVPHAIEDFEYESSGPSNTFTGPTNLGVPAATAYEAKALWNSLDGNFSSCFFHVDSNNMVVEKVPSMLPNYLGATSRLRNISYLQLRSFHIQPIYG